MLKLGIIFVLLASIAWRTTPTNCRHATNNSTNSGVQNMNELLETTIFNSMDVNEHPCHNFYNYACGHWYQQHIDEFGFGNTLQMLDYTLNRKLEHLLKKYPGHGSNGTAETSGTEESLEGSAAGGFYEKVRTYYKSCKRVKPYNLKKYLQLVQPSNVTHWYIFYHNRHQAPRLWQAESFDWLLTIARLRLYGLNGVLLREDVLPRWDESNNNSIYLNKPDWADTKPIASWTAWVEIMLDIGQTKHVANNIARTVHNFEYQLHKLQEVEDDEGVKEMRLSYLQEYLPQINWLLYLQTLKGRDIDLEITVIIRNIPYMRALVKLLQNAERETLCNYIMLKFLKYLSHQGPAEISKLECLASLRRAMPLALSYIVHQHFYKDPKHNDRTVQRIFNQIKHTFYETLIANKLQLEQPVVETLLQKSKNMRIQVGNSPRNVSSNFFDKYYERVSLDSNQFYVNQLSLLRLAVEKSHESLDVTNNDTDYYAQNDWLGSSSTPFYDKPNNIIVVPFGFLQMPLYHRQLHDIYKFSALGFVIAHELMHGFDTSGIDYDSAGNIMGPSEEISANVNFRQGLRCMQNKALGTRSRNLNEQLADYEGLRLVYATYFHGSNTSQQAETLTPQNTTSLLSQFSEEQVFFLNFAQLFCGKELGDPRRHTLNELRVIQNFAVSEELQRAFDCTRPPQVHCRLW